MRPSKAILAAKAVSRANGARSRGPVSEEGKRRSSLNAIRHGLLAKAIVLGNESEEIFARHLAQHQTKLEPADDVEAGAVEEMAAASWRLRRLWTIETRMFDNAIAKCMEADERDRLTEAFTGIGAGNGLQLLDRYENKLHRMYHRSLNNFLILRDLEKSKNSETNLDSDKPC